MWLNFDAANCLPVLVPLDAFWISAACDNSDDSLDYSDIHPWIRHALDSKACALVILKHSSFKPLLMEGYPFPFTSVYLKILGLCHCSIDDWVQCNILSALTNATSLTLVSPSVYEDVVPKVLCRDLPRCGTFSKLKRLHLGEWFLSRGCYPLIYLLRCSPGIEKVILQLDKVRHTTHSLYNDGTAYELSLIIFFIYQSGAYDFKRLPNALAEICPRCKEATRTFGCEKLRKIRIYCHLQDGIRAKIIMFVLSTHISPLPSIKIKPIRV
ncbi:hypothetical protein HU200_063649 [Digitaria exilis]|uniref:Uncharacterized protein n=1 Tax=Digitaria exilis TaxID=1010633 RepID=A0A835DV49_9POAL|nr:hypothetical protein HU200_063649 [Digitaria exilis]